MRRILWSSILILGSHVFASEGTSISHVDIPAQPLSTALRQFAEQTGLQLAVETHLTEGKSAPAVKGEFSTEDALARLLQGTGLFYRFIDEHVVALSAGGGKTSHRSDSLPERAGLELAQAHQARNTATADETVSDPNPASLQEIVVTAQKREEQLQDVPISLTVVSGADLDSSTVRDVTEALTRVPGVSVQESFLSGFSQVRVRGVTAPGVFNAGPSPTAYYLDGMPFGFAKHAFGPDPDAYDLERVEVLRGPQGTLYGASALNGVVRVLSKDADLNEFGFKARGLTSNTETGGWNYRGDMAVNVPIVEGKLAMRAVLGYHDLAGWVDKPLTNTEDVNDGERRIARIKINAQPTEALSIGLSAWLSRADYGAPASAIKSGDEFLKSSLIDEPTSTDYDVYGLKVAYDFPGFTVNSMTSYLDYSTKLLWEVLRGTGALALDTTWDAQTFAQEFNFTSTHEGPWRWSAGAIYRDSEDVETSYLPPVFLIPRIAPNLSESYAVFGELTRLFGDGKWELTAGLRYFEDELRTTEESRIGPPSPDPFIDLSAKFSATTPRVVLIWHASEQLTAYASYAEGFRSGFNQDFTVISLFPPIEPDTLNNYELGAKGNLAGGRISYETALYYIDWRGVQQFVDLPHPLVPGGTTLAGLNGESASGLGFDFAITARPVDALQLGLNFSWNDLTLDADVRNFVVGGPPEGIAVYKEGDRLGSSVEYTVGASADYIFPLGGNGFEGLFSLAANYTSELSGKALNGFTVTTTSGDPILLARTSLSIRAPEHWTASLFVDNLNNEDGLIAPNSGDLKFYPRPRTIGVQFEYAW